MVIPLDEWLIRYSAQFVRPDEEVDASLLLSGTSSLRLAFCMILFVDRVVVAFTPCPSSILTGISLSGNLIAKSEGVNIKLSASLLLCDTSSLRLGFCMILFVGRVIVAVAPCPSSILNGISLSENLIAKSEGVNINLSASLLLCDTLGFCMMLCLDRVAVALAPWSFFCLFGSMLKWM